MKLNERYFEPHGTDLTFDMAYCQASLTDTAFGDFFLEGCHSASIPSACKKGLLFPLVIFLKNVESDENFD